MVSKELGAAGTKAEAGSQLWKEILGRVEGAILCALRGRTEQGSGAGSLESMQRHF